MADCNKIPECAFYNDKIPNMPGTAEFMKMVYCHQRFEECQRFSLSKQSPVNDAANNTDPVGLNVSSPVQ